MNKKVLITGAASGIGSEIAVRYAENGWDVICHYHSSNEKKEALNKAIKPFKVDCHMLKANFSLKEDVSRFIGELDAVHVDALINNAGTYIVSKHFSKLSADDINESFMVNAISPMLLSSHLFMRMKKNGFGRIVNISSVAAKYGGSDHSMHYGCSKRALEGITKTLAKDGAAFNVLVNTIRPGVIDTDFHKKFPKNMEKRIEMIPVKKMGYPKDIADLAYYLGSEKNSFITNEVVTISGGE